MATNNHVNRHNTTAIAHPRTTKDQFQVMQRAFDTALDSFFDRQTQEALFSRDWEHLQLTPSLDVVDEGKYLKVVAELPGMSIDDIKISLENSLLTICGDKGTSAVDKRKNYLKREICYGSYQRSFSLPEGLDVNKAKATFKKGMLWIEIPKRHAKLAGKKQCLKIVEL